MCNCYNILFSVCPLGRTNAWSQTLRRLYASTITVLVSSHEMRLHVLENVAIRKLGRKNDAIEPVVYNV